MKKIMLLILVFTMIFSTGVFADEVNSSKLLSVAGKLEKFDLSDDETKIFLSLRNEKGELFDFEVTEETITHLQYHDTDSITGEEKVYVFFETDNKVKVKYLVFVYDDEFVQVGTIDKDLIVSDMLKLNITEDSLLINQYWEDVEVEDLYGNEVIVVYETTTKSIPAQTTPSKVVLIETEEEQEVILEIDKDLYSDWAIEGLIKAVNLEIIPNYEMLKEPKRNITREEFAEIIMDVFYNLGGKKPQNPMMFSDTNNITLAEASEIGIISGVGNNKFAPERNITREEMAVIFERLMNKLEISIPVTMNYLTFADSDDISGWANNAVQTMNKLGIIQGVGNDRINPKGNTPIEQAIVMTIRFIETIEANRS